MKEEARSNPEWRRWGVLDPLWSVATITDKKCHGDQPWTEDEFYRLGKSDWQDFAARWQGYSDIGGTCLVIGCGAGRLTHAMTANFDQIIGVDVSAGMLDQARSHHSQDDITYVLSDGLHLPVDDESVDAVFSAHTFQHLNSRKEARLNLAEASRALRPHSSLMVHLPIHIWPGRLSALEHLYQMRSLFKQARARISRWMMRRGRADPIMRTQSFSWPWLEENLRTNGFERIELQVFRMSSTGGTHPVVLATKSK